MRILLIASPLVLACLTACDQSTSSASGTASTISTSSKSGDTREISLSGATGHAELAGDKIVLKDRTIFVNGISFGSLPPGTAVKYTVTSNGRVLFVGSETHSAVK